MEKIMPIFYMMFVGWIGVLGATVGQNDDTELLQQVISALTDNRKIDARDIMYKKGTGNDVRAGSRNTEDIKAVEGGKTFRARGHGKEGHDDFFRAIEAFLNSKRARVENERGWLQDDLIIRGTNTTSTSTVVPSTSPTTTTTITTTSASSSRVCFWFWGRKYCIG